MLRGRRWECGYCGDFGSISSLQPSEKAKLAQACAPSVRITVTVTATSQEEEAPFSPACTAPEAAKVSCFSRAVLEDMVRRWDLEQNEWACRDLLIAAFPQATGRWSAEELAEMDTMDLLVETGRQDPETALRMVELLLSTAEGHLQEPEAANQLLGWDMSDLLVSEEMLPLLVRELRKNGRLAVSCSRAPMWAVRRKSSSTPAGGWESGSFSKGCWSSWPAIPFPMMRPSWSRRSLFLGGPLTTAPSRKGETGTGRPVFILHIQ